MMSALSQLADFGQSFWLDNLSREMLRNGDLQRRVEGGLLGITSNPAIFDKAMRGGSWYEAEVEHLGASGLGPSEIYEQLTVADVGETPQTHPTCLLYTSPSPRDRTRSRMPSSA